MTTLRGVARGEASLSRGMASRLLEELSRPPVKASREEERAGLSARERQALALVAEGRSNKEIAASLDIAENTVKNHLQNILEKLHLESRVQAATFAVRSRMGPERGDGQGGEGGLTPAPPCVTAAPGAAAARS